VSSVSSNAANYAPLAPHRLKSLIGYEKAKLDDDTANVELCCAGGALGERQPDVVSRTRAATTTR
jgi:hypothetical protein